MDLRTDPLSGRLVAVAPNRRRRPGATFGLIDEAGEAELDECPFCAGHEDRTPPETYRVGAEGTWVVRVVPNLYPAFDRQEVVIHSPRHVRTFADLDDEEVAAVAQAWEARRIAVGRGYLHACVNEGRAAGSSIAHSHSQLVWFDEPPPEVAHEHGPPPIERELTFATHEEMAAAVHPAGRLPYESLITGDPFDLPTALLLLRQTIRRLRTAEGPVPWNAWLHPGHLEVVPRLNVLAGVELGAGVYVNTVAPEDAAETLRGAL